MAKKIDPTLSEQLRQESERTKDDAYPKSARGSRPNRTKVYSVRLSDQEEDQIQKLAESKHLPPSTLVRSWILERLDRAACKLRHVVADLRGRLPLQRYLLELVSATKEP